MQISTDIRLCLLPDAPEGTDGPPVALAWPATGRGWYGPLNRKLFPTIAAAVAAKAALEAEGRRA